MARDLNFDEVPQMQTWTNGSVTPVQPDSRGNTQPSPDFTYSDAMGRIINANTGMAE